jgi:C_GCAxxG_C_C family probable redox protein
VGCGSSAERITPPTAARSLFHLVGGTILAMNKSEHAAERFGSGLNCSQAVLGEFAEGFDLDLDLDVALRIACGFGGGMGRMGGTCGAVTGAIMVIGLIACGPDPCDPSSKARVAGLVRSFVEQFEAKHGATLCRDLLGCDISSPEGHAEAESLGLFKARCPQYVKDAVEMLQAMFPGGAS